MPDVEENKNPRAQAHSHPCTYAQDRLTDLVADNSDGFTPKGQQSSHSIQRVDAGVQDQLILSGTSSNLLVFYLPFSLARYH
jgi:hypothetical protein